jgi:hypothetical protein
MGQEREKVTFYDIGAFSETRKRFILKNGQRQNIKAFPARVT